MLMPSQIPSFQPGMKQQQQQQQPFYSYNPNAKPRTASGNSIPTPTGNEGLSQTLAPSSLDASGGNNNNNNMFNNAVLQSGANDYFNTSYNPVGLELGGDANASFDAFSKSNGGNSGQVTPDEDWMANMLQEDFFDTSVQA